MEIQKKLVDYVGHELQLVHIDDIVLTAPTETKGGKFLLTANLDDKSSIIIYKGICTPDTYSYMKHEIDELLKDIDKFIKSGLTDDVLNLQELIKEMRK